MEVRPGAHVEDVALAPLRVVREERRRREAAAEREPVCNAGPASGSVELEAAESGKEPVGAAMDVYVGRPTAPPAPATFSSPRAAVLRRAVHHSSTRASRGVPRPQGVPDGGGCETS